MTHKLISIHHVADRLGVSVEAVQDYVNRGWLIPELPDATPYFDADEVQRFRKRLTRLRLKAWLKWPAITALTTFVALTWLLRRPKA